MEEVIKAFERLADGGSIPLSQRTRAAKALTILGLAHIEEIENRGWCLALTDLGRKRKQELRAQYQCCALEQGGAPMTPEIPERKDG